MDSYFLDRPEGQIADLGVVRMRLLIASKRMNSALAVAEFRGDEGAWTVPHMHKRMEESFYVLDGTFTFTVAGREVEAHEGAFLMVPRGTSHVIRCGSGGGSLLSLFTPGGLEEMFLELGRLPADSITNPEVRAAIAKRHDSIPV